MTYGGGQFVAVSNDGTGNRVMTSPDGSTWTSRTSAADNSWYSVTYGGGQYVAVGSTGVRVMTSPGSSLTPGGNGGNGGNGGTVGLGGSGGAAGSPGGTPGTNGQNGAV